MQPQIVVVDDFLPDPDAVRELALRQPFHKGHSAGVRTVDQFLTVAPFRAAFSVLLGGREIVDCDNKANGRFQLCLAGDSIPHHTDSQSAAGVLFLTPDAPVNAGLSFFRGRIGGLRRRSVDPQLMEQTFGGGSEFDRSRWEEIDRVGNIYNRLVLFEGFLAHGATAYFGTSLENGRLFQNFFFDLPGPELASVPIEAVGAIDSPAE
jgi:hypothetical protein